ncbi:ferritin [Saccharicrinis fermentans]|uniref:Ferritin n=1 Tax=Saccharicrinis fermentans DSM 9555 = JCM 21142 TaxID=869213 RepID=W7YJX9_9BACT|nr:ferritin [Saccharicrinis fermentans]GAF04841.1 ferritin [Saccharicrinis fermentans DSM 9555 = JCM 21142]
MLKKPVENILVRQIEREAYSSNLYLSMASWAETNGFGGVSEWMYAQAEEEKIHLLKFMKYVNERGGKAVIPSVEQPPADFADVQELFERTLEHEQYVTESISEIVGVCLEEKDFTTHNWIQWFVTEQIEEEASVRNIIDKLKLLQGQNLYLFDRDVAGMRGTVPGSQQ